MIKTIRLKSIIKYLVSIIFITVLIIGFTRFFKHFKKIEANNMPIDSIAIFRINLPTISNDKDYTKENKQKRQYTARSGPVRILDFELPSLQQTDKTEEILSVADEDEVEEETKERTTSQIKDNFTNSYGTVKVKNLTSIPLTEEMLKPDYKVKNAKEILIYHTHTCESYTPTKENTYTASGNFRTTDSRYSVVRVGKELKEELNKLNFLVVQDETKHDYPAYTGSYNRSLQTVEELLKKNNKAEIIFDIHRDAVGKQSDYAPIVEIEGEKVAQLMFVIGTNDGGGKHPNWQNNLKFAVLVQEKANEMYPGLFRSINLRSATFNQKVANAASIIEVGATGNTLEEATASMKYLAKVLEAVLS